MSGQTLVNQNVTGPCSRFEVNNQKVFLPVYVCCIDDCFVVHISKLFKVSKLKKDSENTQWKWDNF